MQSNKQPADGIEIPAATADAESIATAAPTLATDYGDAEAWLGVEAAYPLPGMLLQHGL